MVTSVQHGRGCGDCCCEAVASEGGGPGKAPGPQDYGDGVSRAQIIKADTMSDKQSTEISPELLTLPESNGTESQAGPDPFDPASLRLTGDIGADMGVSKVILEVPCRKPSKEWFVRVHPDEGYHLQTCVIELKESRETYLVSPGLWPELAGETTFSPRGLYTSINRQGDLFIWPIRLPDDAMKNDRWSRSALAAAEMARSKWVRVQPNMRIGGYELITADQIPDPTWPDMPFGDLLRLTFQEAFIDSLEHPVIRQLQGRA